MTATATTPPTVAPAMIPAFCVEEGGAGSWLGLGEAFVPVVVAEAEEDAPFVGRNTAAIAGFDDRKPAVTSPSGQPAVLAHASDLQHPTKGGSVKLQECH